MLTVSSCKEVKTEKRSLSQDDVHEWIKPVEGDVDYQLNDWKYTVNWISINIDSLCFSIPSSWSQVTDSNKLFSGLGEIDGEEGNLFIVKKDLQKGKRGLATFCGGLKEKLFANYAVKEFSEREVDSVQKQIWTTVEDQVGSEFKYIFTVIERNNSIYQITLYAPSDITFERWVLVYSDFLESIYDDGNRVYFPEIVDGSVETKYSIEVDS